jgi:hypothetical protein
MKKIKIKIIDQEVCFTKNIFTYLFHKNFNNHYTMIIKKNNKNFKVIYVENKIYRQTYYVLQCRYFSKNKTHGISLKEQDIFESLKEEYILNIEIIEKLRA